MTETSMRITRGLHKYLQTELRHFCRNLPYCNIGASRKEVDNILDDLILEIDKWYTFYPNGKFLLDCVFGNEDIVWMDDGTLYGGSARKEYCRILNILYEIAKIIDLTLELETPSPTSQKFQTLRQKLIEYGVWIIDN